MVNLEGYLVKKVMYIDSDGNAHDSIRNAALFKFKDQAESVAIEKAGQVIKVEDGRKQAKQNQGWMRKG